VRAYAPDNLCLVLARVCGCSGCDIGCGCVLVVIFGSDFMRVV